MKQYTKTQIVEALTNLGQSLGFNVVNKNASGELSDQPDEVITVQFATLNEAEGDLAKLVGDFGGVEKVREALTAAVELQAVAKANAAAEEAKRNALADELAADEGIGMSKEELLGLPTRVLETLARPQANQGRVSYALRSGGPAARTNASAAIAPRPSVLLKPPASQSAN